MTPATIPAPNGRLAYGLYPGGAFGLTTGRCSDRGALPSALWYFRQETIALPGAGVPVAGFDRRLSAQEDLGRWCQNNPPGAALAYPALVWAGSQHVIESARFSESGDFIATGTQTLPFSLVPKLESNRSYFNAASLSFFRQRELRLGGQNEQGRFIARTIWPSDFRLDSETVPQSISASPDAIRAFVRSESTQAGHDGFSIRLIWQRDQACAQQRAGRPLIGLMLNGAQGDDDEAHGGHFGLITGRVGEHGEMHDWLMANFYTLDSDSEKGILSAMLPLDNYLADLNSGQSWYRPSWLLVATLRDERTATHLSSALSRVFSQFYRHQFLYRHATDNCAGICLSTLRTLGWRVPLLGATSWWKAFAALFVVSLGSRSLTKGKAMFDYFTEERTRLFPALAFEEAGADLLRLVTGSAGRDLTSFEQLLRDDVDEMLLVHVPQLPSSRVAGTFPVVSIDEYRARLPKNPRDQQIIPVAARPFPIELRDPLTPPQPGQRSDHAVAALLLGIPLVIGALAGVLSRWRRRRSMGKPECDRV